MAESGADMMFVAFSSPKEYWVNKYINQLNIPFVMGVGGKFRYRNRSYSKSS